MSSETPQEGFLFVADITGYTAYLTESELDHARGTLTDLMEVLIESSGPPLTIAKLEGDAVFSYGFSDAFSSSQTFVELVENTYARFRRAIDSMVLNNTCQCNACANVSSLDLKFVIHYGEFLFQDLWDRRDLLGPDVALVHRLLKNSVKEALGVGAYCLYTQAAVEKLEIEGLEGLGDYEEQVDGFGLVRLAVQDMEPAYVRAATTDAIELKDDDIVHVMEHDFPMGPAALWDYLSDPRYRTILIGSDRQEITGRVGGRIDVGTVYTCYHGNNVLPQKIIQWKPFERVVTEDTLPKPMKGTGIAVMELTPTADGTRLIRRLSKPGWKRALGSLLMVRAIRRISNTAFDDFVQAVTEDWERKRRADGSPVTREAVEREAAVGVTSWATGDGAGERT